MAAVIGIDEVGRGSWAGPLLVVAARHLADLPANLKDSKMLTRGQREALMPDIMLACQFGEGWVQPEEIDQFGLARALRTGVSRALIKLGADLHEEIIIDGRDNYCPAEFTLAKAIVKADSTHPIVMAASVYAKVMRDKYMMRIAQLYPVYEFDKHVGYGTRLHRAILQRYGLCKLHRRSYKPIQALLKSR